MSHFHHCEHTEEESAADYTLYEKIDKDRVQCLNELVEGSGVTVFKPWIERLSRDKYVESDVDAELLFNIPFTGHVKLKSIIIFGDTDLEPTTVKLYKDRPNMVFDDIYSPDQEIQLQTNANKVLEYPVRTVKFSSLYHLSLYFSGTAEKIKLFFIGLKGDWTRDQRHGVTICTYEARPQISDHVVSANEVVRQIK